MCFGSKYTVSSVLVLFRAAVSAIESLAVLLTVYFVQLLSYYCKFEQIKIDWLIDKPALTHYTQEDNKDNYVNKQCNCKVSA